MMNLQIPEEPGPRNSPDRELINQAYPFRCAKCTKRDLPFIDALIAINEQEKNQNDILFPVRRPT
jgi:hypothetical protein